jgi:uncharacterized damage-inducible protein DinB
MKEVERIVDQLQRAFAGEAWHGPSLQEVLEGVSTEQAVRRPLPLAHTIWEIVLHIAGWKSVVHRRLSGEVIGDVADDQDWPPVGERSEAAWRKTVEELERCHQQLRQAVAQLTDERLGETVPAKGYSVYAMLHGILQHDLYHAGQIALLKKALG